MLTLFEMLKDYLKMYLKYYCPCYHKLRFSRKYQAFLENLLDHKYFVLYKGEKEIHSLCIFSECQHCGHLYLYGKLPKEPWLRSYYKSFNSKYFNTDSRIEDFRKRVLVLFKNTNYKVSVVKTRKY